MGYRHLSKDKKRYKGKTQPVDLKIVPTDKRCTRTSLDSSGTPQPCCRPGYVRIGEVVFCKGCFSLFVDSLNNLVASLEVSSGEEKV